MVMIRHMASIKTIDTVIAAPIPTTAVRVIEFQKHMTSKQRMLELFLPVFSKNKFFILVFTVLHIWNSFNSEFQLFQSFAPTNESFLFV